MTPRRFGRSYGYIPHGQFVRLRDEHQNGNHREQYGRTQNQVFPTGVFPKGGTYGTDVNLQLPQAERINTQFTACTDRNA